jgi:hypothetical protein
MNDVNNNDKREQVILFIHAELEGMERDKNGSNNFLYGLESP